MPGHLAAKASTKLLLSDEQMSQRELRINEKLLGLSKTEPAKKGQIFFGTACTKKRLPDYYLEIVFKIKMPQLINDHS